MNLVYNRQSLCIRTFGYSIIARVAIRGWCVTAKFRVFGIFIHLLVCLRNCLPVIMFVIYLGHCLSNVLLLSEFLLWLVLCYVVLWLICKSLVRASFCVCLGSCLIEK